MHPNQEFRKTTTAQNIDFARQRGFGILAINGAESPLMAHIPFVLSEDGKLLEAHLVRSNPILRQLENPVTAVLEISGPDSYVSPDWYETDNQVPTWNYIAVKLTGQLKKLPQDQLAGILVKTSHQFETRLAPKPVWTMDKVDEQALQKMQRMIVPISFDITSIDSTWKLAQNKPDEARLKAAKQVRTNGIGQEVCDLADLMESLPH